MDLRPFPASAARHAEIVIGIYAVPNGWSRRNDCQQRPSLREVLDGVTLTPGLHRCAPSPPAHADNAGVCMSCVGGEIRPMQTRFPSGSPVCTG
jgi:hypothetical protein